MLQTICLMLSECLCVFRIKLGSTFLIALILYVLAYCRCVQCKAGARGDIGLNMPNGVYVSNHNLMKFLKMLVAMRNIHVIGIPCNW